MKGAGVEWRSGNNVLRSGNIKHLSSVGATDTTAECEAADVI